MGIHTVNTFTMLIIKIFITLFMALVFLPAFAIYGFLANIFNGEFGDIVETQKVNWFGFSDAVRAVWREM